MRQRLYELSSCLLKFGDTEDFEQVFIGNVHASDRPSISGREKVPLDTHLLEARQDPPPRLFFTYLR